MRTITTTVYEFDELTDDAKQKVIENLCDINVDYDWWDTTYQDAKEVGLNIGGFDTYRGTIEGKLTDEMQYTCKSIMVDHGIGTDTYKLAEQWQHKHGEDNEEEFTKLLLEEYLSILRKEYEYLTSEEAIIDTIEANEYEFTKDGELV